ncbi:hypothetical protein [Halobacillus ihumii]|uniref:hypothetical protein n=1 Tax=Halobacillus ihumii TaxID=2686092 RepID=UPI0013D2DEC6|nr:hypothetical protein [Halobacillus ihumii]
MSLTKMLKGKSEIEIELQTILRNIIPTKKEFSTFSGNEAFSSKKGIDVPYILNYSYQSSVVGTAFDYMARFIVSQNNDSNKEDVSVGLTARHGLEILQRYCATKTSKSLEAKFNKGLVLINKFVKRRKASFEKLLPYATYMARLEHIFRSGMPPKDIEGSLLSEEENEIIVDLKRLCEVFIERFMIPQIITPESSVVFNPHFGIASQSCGGADADIYIDGTLYDFKTSKLTGYKWQEISQIFGYYFLNCIAADLKDTSAKLDGYEIKRLAFYKARYGEIEYIDISSMQTKKMESAIKETNELLNIRKLPSRSERNYKMNRKVVNNISMRFAYLFVLLLLIFSFFLTYPF